MTTSNANKLIVGYKRNFTYPDLFRQSTDGCGNWHELRFIDLDKTPLKKVDVLVVINHPLKDFSIKVRKGGKVLLIQEPPYEENKYLKLMFKYFNHIVCDFSGVPENKHVSKPAALPWHINKSFSELKNAKPVSNKADKVSWITSSLGNYPGHKLRLKFIDFLKEKQFNFDLFGRGFNPIEDKYDGIKPYKYSIAVENYSANDYFTEKIIDVYLSDSIPFYYGCMNIEDYFPKNSFVKLDLERPQWSLDKIKDTIQSDFYAANIEAIKEAKNRILYEYQFFPFMKNLIEQKMSLHNKFEKIIIRKDGATLANRLRQKLNF